VTGNSERECLKNFRIGQSAAELPWKWKKVQRLEKVI